MVRSISSQVRAGLLIGACSVVLVNCSFIYSRSPSAPPASPEQLSCGIAPVVTDAVLAAAAMAVAISAGRDTCIDSCNFDGRFLYALPAALTGVVAFASAGYGVATINTCLAMRHQAELNTARTADPRPSRERASPDIPIAYVAAGAATSVDGGHDYNFRGGGENNALAIDVGGGPRELPVWGHGSLELGQTHPHANDERGQFWRGLAGIELSPCRARSCGILGIDVGYQRQGDDSDTSRDPFLVPAQGWVVSGRLGVDIGLSATWRLQLAFTPYSYWLSTTSPLGGMTTEINESAHGWGARLAVGYRFSMGAGTP